MQTIIATSVALLITAIALVPAIGLALIIVAQASQIDKENRRFAGQKKETAS